MIFDLLFAVLNNNFQEQLSEFQISTRNIRWNQQNINLKRNQKVNSNFLLFNINIQKKNNLFCKISDDID